MNVSLSEEQVIKLWKEKVYDKEGEIDPSQEQDWGSMAIGFALALGYRPDAAHRFVNKLSTKGIL